jgi:hypothetical protein
MADYKLTSTDYVIRALDQSWIPNDPGNAARQEYDRWLADGGVPDPADPPPPPPRDSLAEADKANERLDAGVTAAEEVVGTRMPRAMPPHSVPPTVDELQTQIDYLAEQTKILADSYAAMVGAHKDTGVA